MSIMDVTDWIMCVGEIIELDQRFRQLVPRPAIVRRLRQPGWISELASSLPLTRFDIANAFENVESDFGLCSSLSFRLPDAQMRRSAGVLVLLAGGSTLPTFVLTRRAISLKTHAGEIAFPGGKIEPGETPLDAAIRETYEEIGIAPESIKVIGKVAELSTFTNGVSMSAYLGVSDDPYPRYYRAESEVEAVLETSIAELVTPGTYHREMWRRGTGEQEMHFFALDHDLVWGATAYILVQALKRVHSGLFTD